MSKSSLYETAGTYIAARPRRQSRGKVRFDPSFGRGRAADLESDAWRVYRRLVSSQRGAMISSDTLNVIASDREKMTGDLSIDDESLKARGAATRVEVICQRVESMIARRELLPGGKLNELALATDLGIGRNLLREAVRLMEKSGLVRIEPNRGVFIRELDIKGVLDLFDVRIGLARVAGQLAAMRASQEQRERLEELHSRMALEMDRGEADEYFALNTLFHSMIFELSGNQRLSGLEEMIAAEMHLFRRQNLLRPKQLQTSHREHSKIVEAIVNQDSTKAAVAFETHIRSGRQGFLDMISQA
jgi:DNA-binding GntR family transcriptional regulator